MSASVSHSPAVPNAVGSEGKAEWAKSNSAGSGQAPVVSGSITVMLGPVVNVTRVRRHVGHGAFVGHTRFDWIEQLGRESAPSTPASWQAWQPTP